MKPLSPHRDGAPGAGTSCAQLWSGREVLMMFVLIHSQTEAGGDLFCPVPCLGTVLPACFAPKCMLSLESVLSFLGPQRLLGRKRLRFGHGGEAVPWSPAGPRTPSNKCPKVLLVPGLFLHSVSTLMLGRGQDAWRDVCDVH